MIDHVHLQAFIYQGFGVVVRERRLILLLKVIFILFFTFIFYFCLLDAWYMTRTQKDDLKFDLKIEKIAKYLRKQNRL